MVVVFVPSRGFLFFYIEVTGGKRKMIVFSSPHGDFSFSILNFFASTPHCFKVFVPSRGFLFFYCRCECCCSCIKVFVPSRGFLFFYVTGSFSITYSLLEFSSPHGDFSFSILSHIPLINQGLFL